MTYVLRDYQEEGVRSVLSLLSESQSVLGVAATGGGKAVILAESIRRMGLRTLVLVHREELVYQLKRTIERATGWSVGVEMNVHEARNGIIRDKVVIATTQTLAAGRLAKYDAKDFDLIVIDEAHHAISPSYTNVIAHFPGAKTLGATATPDRKDELAMGRVFSHVAFDYDVDYLVRESWLVPIRSIRVPSPKMDFSKVRTTAGDLNGADLASLMVEEEILHSVATPTVEMTGDKRTLGFSSSVDHAERLSEIVNRHQPGSSGWLCGKTPKPERDETLAKFGRGELQRVWNCGVLTEGYDNPGIHYVVMARPTESRSLFAQMCGRVTRPVESAQVDMFNTAAGRKLAIAASHKPHGTVICFVGNAGRHSLICTTDILGGNYDKEIIAKVNERASKGPVDVTAALAEEKMERDRIAMMAAMRERERRLGVIARAEYEKIEIDPFAVLDTPPIRSRGWDKGHRASGPIVEILRREGVFAPAALGEVNARKLLGQIVNSKLRGEPTYRQRLELKYLGATVPATKGEAAALLASLKKGAA